jgi:phosphoglycolate phosphatase
MGPVPPAPLRAVLFDFDGTLVDSAPGLADTANDMRAARGLPPLALQALRPGAGSGARGMLAVAFGLRPGDAAYEAHKHEFLECYPQRMLEKAHLFAGVAAMLLRIEAAGMAWGIVTNKALRFAEPMVAALGLKPRCRVLVGGDSTPHTKPHPAPLAEAARRLGIEHAACAYVGDDERDMLAGRAAGMRTVSAEWGYLGHGAVPAAWPCDARAANPAEVLIALDLT